MKLPCPTCQKPLEWDPSNLFRPFCSERCKLIDLGEWASESRSIPGPEMDQVNDFGDPEQWPQDEDPKLH
jgi:endogenous inhibitor of DNA gyrase (YacG/DUF329 family)